MAERIDRDETEVAGRACRKPLIGMTSALLHEIPTSAVDSYATILDRQTFIGLFSGSLLRQRGYV